MANPILLKAAALIEESGWTQGNYRDADGCYCVMGALYEADTVNMQGKDQWDRDAWNQAYDLFLDYMRETHKIRNLVGWNDNLDPETGKETVVGALRAAAEKGN